MYPQPKRTLLLLSGALVLVSCQVTDLRPIGFSELNTPERQAEASRLFEKARERLIETLPPEPGHWRLVLRDVWKSGFIRQFTPLPSNDEKFELRFSTDGKRAVMTMIGGDRPGLRVGYFGEDEAFYTPRGHKPTSLSSRDRLYLESAVLYLRLPYLEWPFTVKTEVRSISGLEYDVVYASGGAELDKRLDQYLYWFRRPQVRPEFVRFTYREVARSYAGGLAYSDWRRVEGFQVPFHIEIVRDLVESEVIHSLLLEDIEYVPQDIEEWHAQRDAIEVINSPNRE